MLKHSLNPHNSHKIPCPYYYAIIYHIAENLLDFADKKAPSIPKSQWVQYITCIHIVMNYILDIIVRAYNFYTIFNIKKIL